MPLNTLPGFNGFSYARISSMDKRAIGKLTDTNHLESLRVEEPADYDKKIIQIYTQSSLYANDFLDMLNQSTPYYIEGNTDSWKWDIEVPFRFAKIIAVPATTQNLARPGIDGQEFQAIIDKNDFWINQVITPHKIHGSQWVIIKDPEPADTGWLYTFTLLTQNPKVDFVEKRFLEVGIDVQLANITIGEFEEELPGLPSLADKHTMYESLGSAIGYQHMITGWADDRILRTPTGAGGAPLDIMLYMNQRRNETPITRSDVKWEPFIEFALRKAMMDIKVSKMIWAKPGTAKGRGSKQEVKKVSAGVYWRMKYNGNYLSYPKGTFSPTIFRTIFGDLFYRRVDVSKRKVKIYSNEAGFEVFSESLKNEAMNSGFTFQVGDGNRFIQGQGQNLVLNYAFSGMVTRETGEISLVHLRELDLPQSNLEFGQNQKSSPVFMVFDVSPDSNGTLSGNIREVRMKGRPSMTWGYINGRRHHLGFASSQGHDAANMFDGYKIFFDDRYDVFIEDLSRCVLIEEAPQF